MLTMRKLPQFNQLQEVMTVPDTYKKKYSSFSAKIHFWLPACMFLPSYLTEVLPAKPKPRPIPIKAPVIQVIVEDDANLLTDEEETTLGKEMAPITTYGSVAFKSIDYNPYYSTEGLYPKLLPRHLRFHQCNRISRLIWTIGTSGFTATEPFMKPLRKVNANTITDNVYKYASDGDYYTCAFTAFGQINTLLEGRKNCAADEIYQ